MNAHRVQQGLCHAAFGMLGAAERESGVATLTALMIIRRNVRAKRLQLHDLTTAWAVCVVAGGVC